MFVSVILKLMIQSSLNFILTLRARISQIETWLDHNYTVISRDFEYEFINSVKWIFLMAIPISYFKPSKWVGTKF